MSYDFNDQDIWQMVSSEHRPTEVGLVNLEYLGNIPVPTAYEFGSEPVCKTCKQAWPCAPATALRDFENGRRKAAAIAMAEAAEQDHGPVRSREEDQ